MSKLIEINWENKIRDFAMQNAPYSNVVGLARSILALGTLLTLLFNPIENILIKKIMENFFFKKY